MQFNKYYAINENQKLITFKLYLLIQTVKNNRLFKFTTTKIQNEV